MSELPQTDKYFNSKILVAPNQLIIKTYPYALIDSNNDYKHNKRSEKENSSTDNKKKINLHNSVLNIIGLGYCNDWQYFLTGTIDPDITDPFDADAVSQKFSEMFEKIKRNFPDTRYCFILEKHQSGAFHIHGFCNLASELLLSPDLPAYVSDSGKIAYASDSKFIQFGIDNKYNKVGLVTVSPIMDRDNVVEYCTKYITKDISCNSKGQKVFRSKGLKSFQIQYCKNPEYDNLSGEYCFTKIYNENNQIITDLKYADVKRNINSYNEYIIKL